MPSTNSSRSLPCQAWLSSRCTSCIAIAACMARSAWSSCGNGAPNTAITASPTNCITVPSAPRIARFIAARCSLSWLASWVGEVRSAIEE